MNYINYNKVTFLKVTFLNVPIYPFLINIFINFFDNFFFIYIIMSKNLSAKYYKENKERLQKNLAKDIKIFLKKTKTTILSGKL